MALHKDFPQSPHAILDPGIRWFPADEALRERIMSQICGYVQTAVVLCKVSVTRPVMRNLAFQ